MATAFFEAEASKYNIKILGFSSVDILKRIYYLWYVTFFVRLWEQWIMESKDYALGNNCLNIYTCNELNAHGLLKIIEKLSKVDDGISSSMTKDKFLP
mgnify:CR=1 FL=1